MHKPLPADREPGFAEFVAILALMIALAALSIDNLLPAFTALGAGLGVADANRVQLVLAFYMIGFATMQAVYGPISDTFGRRPVVLFGMALYCIGSLVAIVADSFSLLLAARIVQGMGAAAPRVLVVAIVRDRYEGREMARVMSFIMMVFIIAPVIAPATGSLLLLVGGWRLIFAGMLALGLFLAAAFGLRMPETLHPEFRRPLSPGSILRGFTRTITTRASIGYATAMGLLMGSFMGYLSSSQQVLETEVYGLGHWFPLAFAAVAGMMGAASFVNSQMVHRLGMRRLAHIGVGGLIAVSALLTVIAYVDGGRPPLAVFLVLMGLANFLFSLTVPNLNAMAMAPVGAIAGTASSFIGSYTMLMAATIGLLVGQAFDGTVMPVCFGYLGSGAVCLAVIVWTERNQRSGLSHG